jgi:hypothetical protein
MPDYIPRTDADFDGWQANWVTYAATNAAALGIGPAELTAIQAAQTAWDADYDAHVTAAAAAQAARAAKDAERAGFVAVLRSFSQQIQKRTGTTDEQRAGLGITVPDTTPTPVPAPVTAPLLNIVTSERLRHVIEASRTAAAGWASRPRCAGCSCGARSANRSPPARRISSSWASSRAPA